MYTVRQLAQLAGISRRTLHYYDEIGLLHPAGKGANGYRYYDDGSLLRLQQIMLYRELDMPLDRIRRILGRRDFDALRAMENHAEELRVRIRHMERLIELADSTILLLKGEKEMNARQMFEPFSEEQQAEYEKEALQMYDPATVKASVKKWKAYTPAEKRKIGEEGNAVYRDFLSALPRGAASSEAQACVERWRRHMEYFWKPDPDQLLGLADLYNSDPRFKANFDSLDPRLAGFVREAVKIYVHRKQK
jgi:DNA-binding transcriptional MerR regulator